MNQELTGRSAAAQALLEAVTDCLTRHGIEALMVGCMSTKWSHSASVIIADWRELEAATHYLGGDWRLYIDQPKAKAMRWVNPQDSSVDVIISATTA